MPVYTISDIIDCFDVGASEIDEESNEIRVQLKGQGFSEEDENDAEDINDAPVFGALGVTSMPYPADETGKCQMIGHRLLECTIAARDTRSAAVIGALQPGETVLHSTDPNHSSRVILKTNKTVMMSKDSNDFDMAMIMDGENNKIQITAFGMIIEMSEDNGIILATPGGAFQLDPAGKISLQGGLTTLGQAPVGNVATVSVAGLAALAAVPAPTGAQIAATFLPSVTTLA